MSNSAFSVVGASGNRGLRSFQIFTSGTAATYTKPANVTSILVECVGSGGGSGGSDGGAGNQSAGGGGGGGGYCRKFFSTAAASYTYTVGAGGAGGAAGNNNGSNGTDTTFDTMSAGGGGFGGGGSTLSTAAGFCLLGTVGAGGASANGDINVTGGIGGNGLGYGANFSSGGPGGLAAMFNGAAGVNYAPANTTQAGIVGVNYGGGGTGSAQCDNASDGAGAAGAAGLIIVWEFA